jgi:hypothetical protein
MTEPVYFEAGSAEQAAEWAQAIRRVGGHALVVERPASAAVRASHGVRSWCDVHVVGLNREAAQGAIARK